MSITHHEFIRSLEPLKRYYAIRVENQAKNIVLTSDGLTVEIRLAVEDGFRLGALSMPSTRVDFSFGSITHDEKKLFWSRFELCFRRGGG